MARIPSYEQNRVQPTGLPSARLTTRADPDAFGAGVARGLGALAGVANDIAQREIEKQDMAAVMAAERELQQWQNQALFDPEKGAFQQKGQSAFDLPERLLPEWDKRVGEIEGRLSERQRMKLRDRAGAMRVQMERDLLRHVGAQAEAFQSAETQAYVETRVNTALLYTKDPARFETELREAQSAYMAGNDHLPPAALALGVQKIESSARAGAMMKLVEEDPLEAQRQFDTWRDKLTPADAAQVERVLKPARVDAEAELAVRRALGEAPDGAGAADVSSVDYPTFRRRLESGARADAKNPRSSALGADQFTAQTWLATVRKANPAWARGLSERELLALRTDPAKSAEMARVLDRENAAALRAAGVAVNNVNLYAAHHFGARAGVQFAKAGADTPVERILSAEAIAANPYLRGKTKGEVVANWMARAGAGAGDVPASSRADVLARLNEIPDREVREAAIRRYKARVEIEEIREAETAEAMTESINTKVEAAAPGTPLRQVLSPAEYAWAAEQGKLAAWEARMEQRLTGAAPKTDPAVFDAIQNVLIKAESGDPAAIAEVRRMDVTRLFTALDPVTREKVHARRLAILQGDQEKSLDFATEDELLQVEVFDKLGIPKSGGKDEDKAIRHQFMQTYWSAVDAKQKELGRKLTSGERQQAMRDLLLPFARTVKDKYLGFIDSDETARGFEIGPVPPTERAQIVAAFQQVYGVAPSEEQVRAYYLRAQGWKPQLETN